MRARKNLNSRRKRSLWKTRRSIAHVKRFYFRPLLHRPMLSSITHPALLFAAFFIDARIKCFQYAMKNIGIAVSLSSPPAALFPPFNAIRSEIVLLNLTQVGHFNKFNSYRDSNEIFLNYEIYFSVMAPDIYYPFMRWYVQYIRHPRTSVNSITNSMTK